MTFFEDHNESQPADQAMRFMSAQLLGVAPVLPVPPADDFDLEDAADGHETGERKNGNARLRKTLGARLALARELNGWGQMESARLLGYSNSTQLSLWEQGKRMPPNGELMRASEVFGVSLDFLFGLDDEPERDSRTAARNALVRRLDEMLLRNSRAVAAALFDSIQGDASLELRALRFVSETTSLCDAVDRFRSINPDLFDDARGGATLLRTARDVRGVLARVGALMDLADRRAEYALQRAQAALAEPESNESCRHHSPERRAGGAERTPVTGALRPQDSRRRPAG